MKNFVKIWLLLCICAAIAVAQKNEQNETVKLVEVPREIVLQVIAVQPDCPIRFENLRYIAYLDGGGGSSYRLRNTGTKPIISVTVATSNGTMNTYGGENGTPLLPGQLVPEPVLCKGCPKTELIPLTNELREKLSLKDPMRSVIVLMVTKIEFTDGTKYEDEKTYKALQTFFDELSDALYEVKSKK